MDTQARIDKTLTQFKQGLITLDETRMEIIELLAMYFTQVEK